MVCEFAGVPGDGGNRAATDAMIESVKRDGTFAGCLPPFATNYRGKPITAFEESCLDALVNPAEKFDSSRPAILKPYVPPENEAVKHDDDKPNFDLIPPAPLTELAKVYTFGAKKYAPHNWELGMRYGRIFAAICRHIFAYWGGETLDPETGLSHMAHAAFGCFALIEYNRTGKGQDDRPTDK